MQIVKYLPYLLSAISVYGLYRAGNLDRVGWAISFGNQAIWLVWIVLSGTWGFIPLNVAMWYVSGRNYLKWSNLK